LYGSIDPFDMAQWVMSKAGSQAPEPALGSAIESDKLRRLRQASQKFWANASPEDHDTHPSTSKVEEWLVSKGFSKSLASKGASIIRPEWAPSGRKPEKG
jgi:hypothetical protein